MTNYGKGGVVGLAAIGMLMSLLAVEVKDLSTWSEVWTPGFISSVMIHAGTVIAAFVSGKLIEKSGSE